MSVALHGDMTSEQKTAETIETIKKNEGRTLVLFPSFEDMKEFKEQSRRVGAAVSDILRR